MTFLRTKTWNLTLAMVLAAAVSILLTSPALAQDGSISGTIVDTDGDGIPNVAVTVDELGVAEVTARDGSYRFDDVPDGSYTVTFTLNENVVRSNDVIVSDGETARADQQVAWEVSFADTMTVFSASRRQERIVEAPAAVTVISEEEVEREASHGQLPKLLEFTPGAEVTQSGLYDFNFNTRGFNSSLNRRIVTLIDGRDPSVPFLGSQEWAAVSFPLDDLASVEMVRGPSSALYGANAFNGVLNLVTRQPQYSEGGLVRLTGGELSTINADLRQASQIGDSGWYYKFLGGYRASDDFSVSRNVTTEYGGPDVGQLPREAIPLVIEDDNEIAFAGLRFDRNLASGHVATMEAGYAQLEGPAFQTGIGRVQLLDVERPWARVNYNTPHWNFLGYYNGREGFQRSLLSGAPLILDSTNYSAEVQGNVSFANERGRVIGGASYSDEEIETAGTLTFADVGAESQAVFAQVEYDVTDRIRAVVAARWDDSDLHDSQISPKASVVFGLSDSQTLRLTYNEAFQVANYSEFFLRANTAVQTPGGPLTSLNLSGVEAALGLPANSLGFANIPILALGNANLDVEEIKTWEIGYAGALGNKGLLTAEYYNSEAENFISDLLPNLGSSAGRLNPDFQFYTPPSNLPPALQAGVLQILGQLAAGNPLIGFLSNAPDGSPILALATYTNFGQVDTQGVDLAVTYNPTRNWTMDFSYSWFDFDIVDSSGLGETQLQPNSPEHSIRAGVGYVADRWDLGLSGRWVDEFDWAVGPFVGVVESYTLFDLVGNYRINDRLSLGLNVSNLTDEEHWQSFGGDLLGRRALASVSFGW